MKKLYPYIYFWFTAVIILLIGEFHYGSQVLDINIHDTYFVAAYRHVEIVLCFLYTLVGMLYWMYNRLNIKLVSNLTAIHTIVTVGTVYLYHSGVIYYTYFSPPQSIFYNTNELFFNYMLFFSALIAQLFFIINSIFSVVKHIMHTKSQT